MFPFEFLRSPHKYDFVKICYFYWYVVLNLYGIGEMEEEECINLYHFNSHVI